MACCWNHGWSRTAGTCTASGACIQLYTRSKYAPLTLRVYTPLEYLTSEHGSPYVQHRKCPACGPGGSVEMNEDAFGAFKVVVDANNNRKVAREGSKFLYDDSADSLIRMLWPDRVAEYVAADVERERTHHIRAAYKEAGALLVLQLLGCMQRGGWRTLRRGSTLKCRCKGTGLQIHLQPTLEWQLAGPEPQQVERSSLPAGAAYN
jgi:hypothetical protein